MKEELDHIIKHKNYRDLSGDELRMLEKEGISKDDFIALKLFFQQMEVDKAERLEKLTPVKSKLDDLFEEKHKKTVIPLWKNDKNLFAQPLLQIAAVVVLIVVFYTNINLNQEPSLALNNQVPQVENLDTLNALKIKETPKEVPNEVIEEEREIEPVVIKELKKETLPPPIEEVKESLNNLQEVSVEREIMTDEADELREIMPAEEAIVMNSQLEMEKRPSRSVENVNLQPQMDMLEETAAKVELQGNTDSQIVTATSLNVNQQVTLAASTIKSAEYKIEKKQEFKLEDKQNEFAILTSLF